MWGVTWKFALYILSVYNRPLRGKINELRQEGAFHSTSLNLCIDLVKDNYLFIYCLERTPFIKGIFYLCSLFNVSFSVKFFHSVSWVQSFKCCALDWSFPANPSKHKSLWKVKAQLVSAGGADSSTGTS